MLVGEIEVDEDCDRIRGRCGKLIGCARVGEEKGCGGVYEREVGDEVLEGGVGGQLGGAVGVELGCC